MSSVRTLMPRSMRSRRYPFAALDTVFELLRLAQQTRGPHPEHDNDGGQVDHLVPARAEVVGREGGGVTDREAADHHAWGTLEPAEHRDGERDQQDVVSA